MSSPRRAGRTHLRLVADLPAPAEPAPLVPVAASDAGGLVTGVGVPGDAGQAGHADQDPATLARDLDIIDRVLAVQPVPQPILGWRAAMKGTFELPWRDLPGTLHQEPSYLAVALVHYPALASVEAVLHLRVPAGTPGVYLNPFDHGDRLPAPTLLLGRGLLLFVHETRREQGQWQVRAELLPQPPAGWPDHESAGGARRGPGRHLTVRETARGTGQEGDDHGR